MARRLVVPKSARSEVWKYFGFEADESGKITDIDSRFGRRFVWCRLCDTQLLFSGNTTNLSSHISRCHKIKICQTERTGPIAVTPKIQNINYSEARGQTDDPSQPEIEMSIDEEIIDDVENSTSEDQQYCLKWKHHRSNQQTMFARLLERESFCDVTIACEEKLIRAHKLVLSACSSYFEIVLSRYEDQNPIIILKDVKYEDMLTLIKFMYRGEVNIVQSHLATFLETADTLKVRGLSDVCGKTLQESSDPLDFSEEKQELSSNGIKQEQGKRSLRDEETQRQIKVARCSTGMKVNLAMTAEVRVKEMRKENKSTFENEEENTMVMNISDTQEGIIRLPQFLTRYGSYQDFWKKPWVLKALKAVSDREMTLRKCSELLGVNYNNLYSRYKELHGSLKDTSPSTSQGYTLNIVNSYSKKEASGNIIVTREKTVNNSKSSHLRKDRGGRIVLRADELTSAAVLNIKDEHSPNQEFMMKVEVENNGQQYKCTTENSNNHHALESDSSKIEEAC